jgi:hypothetical protein
VGSQAAAVLIGCCLVQQTGCMCDVGFETWQTELVWRLTVHKQAGM